MSLVGYLLKETRAFIHDLGDLQKDVPVACPICIVRLLLSWRKELAKHLDSKHSAPG